MPIDIATGDVEIARDDFSLPGRVPIKWTRRYRSGLVGTRESPLGPGWTASWFPTLKRVGASFEYLSPDGVLDTFPDSDGRIERGQTIRLLGAFLELVRHDKRYVVTSWDVESGQITRFVFAADQSIDNPMLVAVENVSGDGVELTWEGSDRLISLRQRIENRTVLANYSPTGRLTSLDLTTKDYERKELVRYEYDAQARLSAAFDRNGLASRYEYDAQSRVSREILADGAVYSYRYDERGRCIRFSGLDGYNEKRLRFMDAAKLTMVTNSYGKTTVFECLTSGQITGEVGPAGHRRRTEFDEFGRIIAKIDPAGATSRYTYDENGNRDSITNALGETYRFTFNAHHQPISVTNPLGKSWNREYDARHRLTACRNPLGARWAIAYDKDGNPAAITDPVGAIRRLRFENGLMREMTDLIGYVTCFKWDEFGRVTERIGFSGERTAFRYDPVGNPVEVELPGGSRLHASYDSGGNLSSFTNVKGHTTRFRYGSCRRLLERVDPLGRVVRYVWGTEPERVESVINEKGETFSYFRDDQGRVIRERSFDGREELFDYDIAGRCIASTNGNGEKIHFKRDAEGRVKQKILPDGTATLFEFDPVGKIIAAITPDISVQFEYDDAGRLTREIQGEYWVRNNYNAAGDVIRTETSLGHDVRYDLDQNGRVRKLSAGKSYTLAFERDARGFEISRQMPGRMRLEQRFDSLGRLLDQRVGPAMSSSELNPVSARESSIPDGHEMIKRDYRYDPDGVVLSIKDSFWGATNYAYDPAERLLSALREHDFNELFEYDATDNLSRSQQQGSDPRDHSCTYGPGNRLLQCADTRYEYDASGRLVRKIKSGSGGRLMIWEYVWDGQAQLRKLRRPDGQTWEYKYDAFGRRISKIGPRGIQNYIWDGDVIIHEVKDVASTVAWITTRGSFAPIAKMQEGDLYPIISDHLGTPREMLDPSGNIVWAACHSAWGKVERKQNPEPQHDCPIRFQGQWFDEESGLHYNRFRYYDPATGRFVSPDPIGILSGRNLYCYSVNPVGAIDPLGLTTQCTDPKSTPEEEPKTNVLPSSGSTFIVSPDGVVIVAPSGAVGPTPVVNDAGKTTGFAFTGGSGGPGLDPRVTDVRIMDPTPPKGASPGYPSGYATYQNATGQGVNPSTGQTIPNKDPMRHIPLG